MLYSYLDYKLCLSMLKAIPIKIDRMSVSYCLETIEGEIPMRINSPGISGGEDMVLISSKIDDSRKDKFFVFQMNENDCFVFVSSNGNPEVEENYTDYKKAIEKFRELIKEYL